MTHRRFTYVRLLIGFILLVTGLVTQSPVLWYVIVIGLAASIPIGFLITRRSRRRSVPAKGAGQADDPQ